MPDWKGVECPRVLTLVCIRDRQDGKRHHRRGSTIVYHSVPGSCHVSLEGGGCQQIRSVSSVQMLTTYRPPGAAVGRRFCESRVPQLMTATFSQQAGLCPCQSTQHVVCPPSVVQQQKP